MNNFMEIAIDIAKNIENEVPVSAIIVKDNKVIAVSQNKMTENNNAIMHAEINVINKGIEITGEKYLQNCDLYVTKEPCIMCFGAIMHARIRRVYFGAYDVKYGACDHILSIIDKKKTNHIPEIYGGIMEFECKKLLEDFFR